MSGTYIADLCDEGNSLINELQSQINVIRNQIGFPSYAERDVYMMGYVVKRLTRVQKSLMDKLDKEMEGK